MRRYGSGEQTRRSAGTISLLPKSVACNHFLLQSEGGKPQHPEALAYIGRVFQTLLFVMNPTDKALTIACRLRELFGDQNWYQYRYTWEETDAQSVREDVFIDTLAPHDSALLFVTEEPLRKKPVNLWNW